MITCRKRAEYCFEGIASEGGCTPRARATTRLLRRVLRRVLETALEKVLRRVLRRGPAVGLTGKQGSERVLSKGSFEKALRRQKYAFSRVQPRKRIRPVSAMITL